MGYDYDVNSLPLVVYESGKIYSSMIIIHKWLFGTSVTSNMFWKKYLKGSL